MDLNLDTLKREIVDYLEASGFAVFRGSPGGLKGLPMVLWDVEHHPDYQMFLDVARKSGAKVIIFAARRSFRKHPPQRCRRSGGPVPGAPIERLSARAAGFRLWLTDHTGSRR